jgi:hypothetical protein
MFFTVGCDRPQSRTDTKPSASERPAAAVAHPPTKQPSTTRAEKPAPPILWGARHADDVIEVELKGLDGTEIEQVAALFEASKSDAGTLDYSASKMPPRFQDIEALDILTPKGPIRLEIATIVRSNGPSRPHYWLHTKPTDTLSDPPSKALEWTVATPASGMADTATMRLAEPTPVHAKAVPKLRDAFLGGLEDDQQERVAKKLKDKHIQSVRARLPDPHAQMVTINVPNKPNMLLAQAAFVADGTGKVTYTVKEPFVGPLGYLTILAVADPDGDGIDGVLYRMDTDGYFIRWMHVDDDGEIVIDTLAGFSA